MARVKDMPNPLHPEYMLSHEETLYVRKLKRAKAGASKAARSGHPGRRAEGQRDKKSISSMLLTVYKNNFNRHLQRG